MQENVQEVKIRPAARPPQLLPNWAPTKVSKCDRGIQIRVPREQIFALIAFLCVSCVPISSSNARIEKKVMTSIF